jgi:hypothetical protein
MQITGASGSQTVKLQPQMRNPDRANRRSFVDTADTAVS